MVDLRSGAYASLWAPGANAVTVRVLHERESGGMVVRALGYPVEPGPETSSQHAPTALDIVVREL